MAIHDRSPYKVLDDAVKPVQPVLTTLLVLLCIWGLYEFTTHGLLWAKNNAFSGGKFLFQLEHGEYMKMVNMIFWATFVQTSIWSFIANIYFVWLFGSTLESRLGTLRYLVLVLACIFGGWYLLYMDIGTTSQYVFLGPGILTCGLIGGYLIFFPEKKINPGGQLRSYKIFKNAKDPNPADSFGISPYILIAIFIAYQVAMFHFMTNTPYNFANMKVIPAIATFIIGNLLALVLVMMSTASVGGHPLRRLAVQRYQQLRALDMTHDQAISGSARLLSVPEEQVKSWVAKGTVSALPEKSK
jgi:membrane associated rhomboid family serine protease